MASIGHAIIQSVRPRTVLAPLQISLSVQMHHLYRSRFLIDTLHQMGFGSSYSEVLRFEKNAAACVAPDMIGTDTISENTALLFAADNVDHNILTIDGKGTFHGMGMIVALTPGQRSVHAIPRHKITDLIIPEDAKVTITDYNRSRYARESIKFQDLPIFPECDKKIDLLWELSFNSKQTIPGWHGMMLIIHQGNEHAGQSSIRYLPMIDMYSGNKTCILSTLEFLCNLAHKYNLDPVITFDQPLYWKAAEIIHTSPLNSHLKSIVLLLGGFHTLMNLLGAIGTLMNGTGLSDIFCTVYGENAVAHTITGKSVQRAFRAHLLVDKCLNRKVVSDLIQDIPEISEMIEEAEKQYTMLKDVKISLESVSSSSVLSQVQKELKKRKREICDRSKTSHVWLNYQRMLEVCRSLVAADRTGSWSAHLHAISNCIPIFAAAGHYNYLKSTYFYLQEMSQLSIKHPDVFKKFRKGFHVIHRSSKFWSGLSSGLIIEQTLMRSLKSSGGLTHGSRISEDHTTLWTLSSPVSAEYNFSMQGFTGLAYTTSEQHKDMTVARIKRDTADLEKISEKLVGCSPYSADPSLRNIVNGIVAQGCVNVHEYESVAQKIIHKMIGHDVFSLSFSRKDKAITLGNKTAIQISPDRTIDCALLFQRFIVVSKSGELSLEGIMVYELCPFPPALFETNNLFRKADKPQLAQVISEYANGGILDIIPETECYVLDGGSLLHRFTWKRGETYGTIANSYADSQLNIMLCLQ